MTDTNGTVVWRADYKPFGEEQSVTQSPENVMKFVGKEKDKETGLYYFGARYMKPEIGRFTSPDTVGPVDPRTSKTNYQMLLNPQKLNRYAYGLNNPFRYLDPDGRYERDAGVNKYGNRAMAPSEGRRETEGFSEEEEIGLPSAKLPAK
jgi:RHS repeat-associated protein